MILEPDHATSRFQNSEIKVVLFAPKQRANLSNTEYSGEHLADFLNVQLNCTFKGRATGQQQTFPMTINNSS